MQGGSGSCVAVTFTQHCPCYKGVCRHASTLRRSVQAWLCVACAYYITFALRNLPMTIPSPPPPLPPPQPPAPAPPQPQVDAERCRILPDGSRWLVDLWGQAADVALANKPYVVRKSAGPRKTAGTYKWLIPLVAYGQVCQRTRF
jgi:hypothetical protein